MKSFLAFLVAMGIIVTLGDASCIGESRKPEWPDRGCIWKGKLYPLGHIKRTEDCYRCNCNERLISCCSLYITYRSYDQENCKIMVDKKHCKYYLADKNDPSKECSSRKPISAVL